MRHFLLASAAAALSFGTPALAQDKAERTAAAALKIAVDMAREGLITENEAVLRLEPSQLDQLLHPTIADNAKRDVIVTGLPASPGAAVGKVVFDSEEAFALAEKGEDVILVRIETSPEDIKGMGADFGAGQGYLSKEVLLHCPKVKHLDLYEAEHRAIACAEKTLEGFENITISWADVTRDVSETRYDFVMMNPPFHVGRADAANLGQAFIQAASRALKPGGSLYMVANRHLPYEATIKACFKQFEIIEDAGGYKIIRADRPKRQK